MPDRTGPTGERRRRALVRWPFAVAGLALLVGAVVGLVAYLVLRPGDPAADEGWADLVAVVQAMLLGLLVAVLAWCVGLVAVVRRLFPRGARWQPTLLTLGGVLLLAAVLTVVTRVTALLDHAMWPAVALLAVLAPAVASLVLRRWDARVGRREGPLQT